jgi:DNA-binding MarR family transcriptional regulator
MSKGMEAKARITPAKGVAVAQHFYAEMGQEVGYFPALWHTLSIGHLLTTDLDRICRKFDLSLADFNLLGALRIARFQKLRATDLAVTLQISNGALTARITKLVERGLLRKLPVARDRRAFRVELTADAASMVENIHTAIAKDSQFVREVNKLSEADRSALSRIMGNLHDELDRHFLRAIGG